MCASMLHVDDGILVSVVIIMRFILLATLAWLCVTILVKAQDIGTTGTPQDACTARATGLAWRHMHDDVMAEDNEIAVWVCFCVV